MSPVVELIAARKRYGAVAVANLIYVPLSFASGLFIPVSQLPLFIQPIYP